MIMKYLKDFIINTSLFLLMVFISYIVTRWHS